MKRFNKKFKVKIQNFSDDYYIILYANYRFIPEWHKLCFWSQYGCLDTPEFWSTKLFKREEAIVLVNNIKSIEDIKEWYKPYEKQRTKFLTKKEVKGIKPLTSF